MKILNKATKYLSIKSLQNGLQKWNTVTEKFFLEF